MRQRHGLHRRCRLDVDRPIPGTDDAKTVKLPVTNTDSPRLALLVGAARSGTTLTRVLLDAHPEVGCPAEAGLPALMAHLAQTWVTVNADGGGSARPVDPGRGPNDDELTSRWAQGADAEVDGHSYYGGIGTANGQLLPADGSEWVVSTVEQVMTAYCAPAHKEVYCDKSLDSVRHLPLVRQLFPELRVVMLFRHVMDTVASGLEASPWGFQAYGYMPYVQAMPGNTVAALASYWLDHVSAAISWSADHPEVCLRVRYEDLVLAPQQTLATIHEFLGVERDEASLESAFARGPLRGPGDYKVDFTTSVHGRSIGGGKRVPVSRLPGPLLDALNACLGELKYDSLGSAWNVAERSVDGGGVGVWAARLADVMSGELSAGVAGDVGRFAVVAEDHRSLRWVVTPELGRIEQADGEVDSVVIGTAQDLLLMVSGEANLGVLVRSGRIRHLVDDVSGARRDARAELRAISGVLQRLNATQSGRA